MCHICEFKESILKKIIKKKRKFYIRNQFGVKNFLQYFSKARWDVSSLSYFLFKSLS